MLSARAAVFEQAGSPLVMREFPVPALGPGEALVRVSCCTVCGSDLHTLRGHRETPVPTVLGHEIVGVVEALASDSPPADVALAKAVRWFHEAGRVRPGRVRVPPPPSA